MSPKIKRSLLIVGLIVAALVISSLLGKMKPPPQKKEASIVELVVETMILEEHTVGFEIRSQGTVKPRTETILSAEVAGTITRVSPKFVAGGVFREGEELLQIDPTNYRVAVEQAQALLEQRQIEYDGAKKLKAQGYRAEAELASAAAALALARTELVRANRNLERTSIKLPYAGIVRSKEVDIGQYVNPGSRLAITFAIDYAEVRLPLADSDLAFVELPSVADVANELQARGPRVVLTATQRGEPAEWIARIVRTEGIVDEKSRVTYAVARIEDPYVMNADGDFRAPLPMGTFVQARIDGNVVEDVIRLPRSAIRGNGQVVFVDEEDRLRIRSVDVLRADADYAYLTGGAKAGDRISVTAIESPINGMKVQTTSRNDEEISIQSDDVDTGN
jgi:RND family efflux transporter MFP subunit